MKRVFNFKGKYPLNDFKKDTEEPIRKDNSNVIDYPKQFGIVNDHSGKVSNYRINTTSPFVKCVSFFMEKYGPTKGLSRLMRFVAVIAFIGKWREILVQKGLLIESKFKIKDDFVKYLLNARINPKTNVIPKYSMARYFKEFEWK